MAQLMSLLLILWAAWPLVALRLRGVPCPIRPA